MRWSALLMISIVMFSSYYFYDVYSGVKSTLQAETGITNAEYGTMYGAYSFTNSILLMAFLGGILLDRWGIRKTAWTFFSFMAIGAFFTAYGASSAFREGGFGFSLFSSVIKNMSPSLKLMILGRLIFGLGAETFYVAINKIIAKWFKHKELALAFGISLAFGRFGTAAAFSLSPRLASNSASIDPVAWFGVMLMMISLGTLIIYIILDRVYDRRFTTTGRTAEGESFSLYDIKLLLTNKSFLYITGLCILFYSAVFPFLGFAPDFLHNKFGFSLERSGDLTTILPYGTVLFTPIFGWFCDNKGKSATVMITGSIMLIFVHLAFSLTNLMPYIPLFLLGVAFSMVPAALWPSVAKIVDEKRLGTAYGFIFTVQNYGLMLFPWFIGLTLDATNKNVPEGDPLNYTYALVGLSGMGLIGLVFALLLKRDDLRMNSVLEKP